ncbi:iron-sulfur cluster biosynthesis family protein [Enterococcus sp. ALS3]|uniref:Iron-sulfur cluster biosynthesis family protein n=1 Tax=Enterococcus alishanensis TaxID=1303817 RepID=A0ABS6TH78_9ENTE|nr:iron-sulfur cluster biosynthesis family protein [Enterococcus alishanensis]MBV7392327.1 iron-sulfur cluster biosynthesis family protein [Enterococcus alishanensis]
MKITLDEGAKAKITAHLSPDKLVLLTFEDGVGAYSQHAMIHMQTQFSINIISKDMDKAGYDETIPTNIGDFWIKGYSKEDLQELMTIKLNQRLDNLILSGEVGVIDDNLGFIDFTEK